MRIIDCEQGSREWVEARLGIPTASEFSRIVTATGKLSAQRDKYRAKLLAEWVTGEPYDEVPDNSYMERGKALEPQARAFYAFHADADVREVGFVGRRVSMADIQDPEAIHVGCSPDGLVGDEGGLELKVPLEHTHINYLALDGMPTAYIPQVQGCLWVTGRAWWDFLSYAPGLPPVLIRVEPDAKYQAALDDHMPTFHAELMAGRERLREKGVTPWGKT